MNLLKGKKWSFIRGWEAFLLYGLGSNPYRSGTENWREWEDGWKTREGREIEANTSKKEDK